MKHKLIIEWLLSQTDHIVGDPYSEFNLWKPVYLKTIASWTDPIDCAIAGGFVADRIAYAFTAGYQASLRSLLPSLPFDTIAALCVSEEGGGHPRQIKTTLRQIDQKESISPLWEINGRKKFITNASEASRLLIAASAGEMPDGKNQIQMIEIERDAPGITVIPMKELPFVPEISHGILLLEGVHVKEENLLPGDGYLKYIKPFRTIEDIHVSTAIIGYLFRIAGQYGWPRDIQEKCLFIFSGFRSLSAEDPGNPAVHIALAGILNQLVRLVDDIEPYWANVEAVTRSAWIRDRKLLDIAREARSMRLKAAWSYFTKSS
ncbi:MAG: acyl-CoA dehydrogenase [Desulfobacterium sp.]|nr:acyl-CoA dehydrogenase [Desulfobacterium sp.]